eukprot:1018910-Rhodomonas_salina.1
MGGKSDPYFEIWDMSPGEANKVPPPPPPAQKRTHPLVRLCCCAMCGYAATEAGSALRDHHEDPRP